MQSLDVPAVHVAQPLSQGWRSLLPSAYWPAGTDARQVEPDLYGVDVAHERQSEASAPAHVAQIEAHPWQTLVESA